MTGNKQIMIFKTPEDLAEELAKKFLLLVSEKDKTGTPFTTAISGGSTPKLFFSIIGNRYPDIIKWDNVHFFWVDERCVPPSDIESNFGMTKEMLLSKIWIPEDNVHRIIGEADSEKEAERYSQEICRTVPLRNGFPCFDLILLGMGEDGHTASIFPSNKYLLESRKICATSVHPITGQVRITLTGPVINNARQIIFMVTGKKKSAVLQKIIDEGDPSEQFPAARVKPLNGTLEWYLDAEAGSLLKGI